ncbi:DUF1661 domain-containing protein [Porphyromonas gingivalis]
MYAEQSGASIFFVLARNFFTSHAKTKKFSHHVFWRYKQENFGA